MVLPEDFSISISHKFAGGFESNREALAQVVVAVEGRGDVKGLAKLLDDVQRIVSVDQVFGNARR